MTDAPPIGLGFAALPGLIWGFDLGTTPPVTIERCEDHPDSRLRWLHLNLADQGTRHWIMHKAGLPTDIGELLLSPETYQHALITGDSVACVLHDLERDFDVMDTARVGALRLVLAPTMIISARLHPLVSADRIRERLLRSPAIADAPAALDLVVVTISTVVAGLLRTLSALVQSTEDRLLEELQAPTTRDLIGIRRRLAQLHRQAEGMHGVMVRLEQDEDLPETLRSPVEKLSQRLAGLNGDIAGLQLQLRLVREELDLQAVQRTNTNLYVLSIMTALLLPATLITGIFGMNTGGLPLAHTPIGTLLATLLAFAAAAGTWFLLRAWGLMRR